MKTLTSLFIALFFITNYNYATVRTVSNDPSGGSQYSNLQAAYNAAVNGDTLHLEGTNIDYSLNLGSRWDKNLTVIGIGFNPQKQNARLTRMAIATNTCCWTNDFEFGASASGSKFYGIYFVVPVIHRAVVSNIVFEDCRFASGYNFLNYTASNMIFQNCIFDIDNAANVYLGTSAPVTNINFTSCVFDGSIDGQGNPFLTMTVDNCLFLSATTNAFSGVRYSTISDCVFMNRFPAGTTDCTFLNNICRVAGTFPPAGTGNVGISNVENADPMFTTYAANQLYATSHNYNLLAGSPAIGTGTAGSNIGVHGSGSGFSNTGEVLINPILRQVIITNPSVAPNGTLNVNINATKPNDN